MSSLEDAYLDGILDKERYLARRGELPKQIQQAREQLDNLHKVEKVDLVQLYGIVETVTFRDGENTIDGETLDRQAWRLIIEGLVERVVIHGTSDGHKNPPTIVVL